MEIVQQYRAEDGSLWFSREACENHERYLRGEAAAKPDVVYLVVSVHGKHTAFKKVGREVTNGWAFAPGDGKVDPGGSCPGFSGGGIHPGGLRSTCI